MLPEQRKISIKPEDIASVPLHCLSDQLDSQPSDLDSYEWTGHYRWLVCTTPICWNYLYLARQVKKAPDVEARENLLRLIAAHSPMS